MPKANTLFNYFGKSPASGKDVTSKNSADKKIKSKTAKDNCRPTVSVTSVNGVDDSSKVRKSEGSLVSAKPNYTKSDICDCEFNFMTENRLSLDGTLC